MIEDSDDTSQNSDDTSQNSVESEDLAWETVASDIEYSCPGFDVRRDGVTFPDGSRGEYHYVEEPPAVVVLPFTPDGDVVVIDEWRQAVGRVNRGLPAGSVDSGDEDLPAAARRELREETGYEADTIEHRQTVEPTNGIAASVHHHFVARGCRPTAEQDLDDDESIRVDTVAYDDLIGDAVDGTLRDGRTVLSLMRYELIER